MKSNDVQDEANAESKPTAGTKVAFDVTCTPAQHFTGRGLFDRCQTLWTSWVVQEVFPDEIASTTKGGHIYFAGDTGYRTVRDGQDEDAVPTCPAFKEIGERFGGFDFAMIPHWVRGLLRAILYDCMLMEDTGHTNRATSCLQSTVHRTTVSPCSRTFVQRKHWVCIGGKLSSPNKQYLDFFKSVVLIQDMVVGE